MAAIGAVWRAIGGRGGRLDCALFRTAAGSGLGMPCRVSLSLSLCPLVGRVSLRSFVSSFSSCCLKRALKFALLRFLCTCASSARQRRRATSPRSGGVVIEYRNDFFSTDDITPSHQLLQHPGLDGVAFTAVSVLLTGCSLFFGLWGCLSARHISRQRFNLRYHDQRLQHNGATPLHQHFTPLP